MTKTWGMCLTPSSVITNSLDLLTEHLVHFLLYWWEDGEEQLVRPHLEYCGYSSCQILKGDVTRCCIQTRVIVMSLGSHLLREWFKEPECLAWARKHSEKMFLLPSERAVWLFKEEVYSVMPWAVVLSPPNAEPLTHSSSCVLAPPMKVISFFLHNCDLATTMKHNVNICAGWRS